MKRSIWIGVFSNNTADALHFSNCIDEFADARRSAPPDDFLLGGHNDAHRTDIMQSVQGHMWRAGAWGRELKSVTQSPGNVDVHAFRQSVSAFGHFWFPRACRRKGRTMQP